MCLLSFQLTVNCRSIMSKACRSSRAGSFLLMAGLTVTLVQPAHSAPLGRASYALEFDGRIGKQWQVHSRTGARQGATLNGCVCLRLARVLWCAVTRGGRLNCQPGGPMISFTSGWCTGGDGRGCCPIGSGTRLQICPLKLCQQTKRRSMSFYLEKGA